MILRHKYVGKSVGRIPLPRTTQELWAQHKYSVLARNPRRYAAIGRMVSTARVKDGFCDLTLELTDLLRTPPDSGPLLTAVQHMWGHVSNHSPMSPGPATMRDPGALLTRIRALVNTYRERFLLASTALGEL